MHFPPVSTVAVPLSRCLQAICPASSPHLAITSARSSCRWREALPSYAARSATPRAPRAALVITLTRLRCRSPAVFHTPRAQHRSSTHLSELYGRRLSRTPQMTYALCPAIATGSAAAAASAVVAHLRCDWDTTRAGTKAPQPPAYCDSCGACNCILGCGSLAASAAAQEVRTRLLQTALHSPPVPLCAPRALLAALVSGMWSLAAAITCTYDLGTVSRPLKGDKRDCASWNQPVA